MPKAAHNHTQNIYTQLNISLDGAISINHDNSNTLHHEESFSSFMDILLTVEKLPFVTETRAVAI